MRARHYGSAADMMRQLGEIDVVAVVSRDEGMFRVGYNVAADQVASVKAVLDAFDASGDWQAWCVVAASALAGAEPLDIPAGSSLEVNLRAAFAAASPELMPAGMLDRGLLQ